MKTTQNNISKTLRPCSKRIQRLVAASSVFVTLLGTTVQSQAEIEAPQPVSLQTGSHYQLMLIYCRDARIPVIVSQAIYLSVVSSLLASGLNAGYFDTEMLSLD